MKSIAFSLLFIFVCPVSIFAQDLTISEIISYLNNHLDDLEFENERWLSVEYMEDEDALKIKLILKDYDEYLGWYENELLTCVLYFDGSFKTYTDVNEGHQIIRFEDDDVVEIDSYGEYAHDEFTFENGSDKTTEVFYGLID